jgi:hypothetical protein
MEQPSAFCKIEQLSGGLFDGRPVNLIEAGALFFCIGLCALR